MEVYKEIDETRRICRDYEQESYVSVYGEPEGYTNADGEEITAEQELQNIHDAIEQSGLWYYFAQKRCPCCSQWDTEDSVGMIIGDIKSTGYLPDLEDSIK